MENLVDNTATLPTGNGALTVPLTVPFLGHRTTVPPCPLPSGTGHGRAPRATMPFSGGTVAPSGDLGEGESSPSRARLTRHPAPLVGDRVTIVVRSFRGPRAGVITEAYRCAGRLVFVVALSPTRRVWLRREDVALARPLEDTPLATSAPGHLTDRSVA